MKTPFHCPYRQSTLLQQALAPDKMRIAFLLGAGCPVSIRIPEEQGTRPLIPDIRGLTAEVNARLSKSDQHKGMHSTLMNRFSGGSPANPTIEDILSHIRALQDVVRDGTIDGLNKAALSALDTAICEITTEVVGVSLPEFGTPYHQLATWIGGIQRAHPIEVFTPNYEFLSSKLWKITRFLTSTALSDRSKLFSISRRWRRSPSRLVGAASGKYTDQ